MGFVDGVLEDWVYFLGVYILRDMFGQRSCGGGVVGGDFFFGHRGLGVPGS